MTVFVADDAAPSELSSIGPINNALSDFVRSKFGSEGETCLSGLLDVATGLAASCPFSRSDDNLLDRCELAII